MSVIDYDEYVEEVRRHKEIKKSIPFRLKNVGYAIRWRKKDDLLELLGPGNYTILKNPQDIYCSSLQEIDSDSKLGRPKALLFKDLEKFMNGETRIEVWELRDLYGIEYRLLGNKELKKEYDSRIKKLEKILTKKQIKGIYSDLFLFGFV